MKILLAIDGSVHSDNAVEAMLKQPWPDGSECNVVTVSESFDSGNFGDLINSIAIKAQEAFQTDIHKLLIETRDKLEQKFGVGKVLITHLEGKPSERIIEETRNWQPDLLVMGTPGTTGTGYNDQGGSIINPVVNHVSCSVRIVNFITSYSLAKEEKAHLPLDQAERFLLAINDSPNSRAVIDSVMTRPFSPGSIFQVLSIVQEPKSVFHSRFFKDPQIDQAHKMIYAAQKKTAEKLVENAASKLESKFGKDKVTWHVLEGSVRSLILQIAQDWPADMIILGAHDRDKSILEHFLGSVAQAVVNNADCSVEIVRP